MIIMVHHKINKKAVATLVSLAAFRTKSEISTRSHCIAATDSDICYVTIADKRAYSQENNFLEISVGTNGKLQELHSDILNYNYIMCVISCVTGDLGFILVPWISTPQNFTRKQLNL